MESIILQKHYDVNKQENYFSLNLYGFIGRFKEKRHLETLFESASHKDILNYIINNNLKIEADNDLRTF